MSTKVNLNLLDAFHKVREEVVFHTKCAWCGKAMGQKTGKSTPHAKKMAGGGKEIITYGICSDCQKTVKEEYTAVAEKNKGKGGVEVSPMTMNRIMKEELRR